MSKRVTLWAVAMWILSVSGGLAEDAARPPVGTLGGSTWLLSYNWQPGSGTTAVTFYEDGTFKTSAGHGGRWVQGDADAAKAFFAFSQGSLPDWSVVYSSTLSSDGLSFSGIQGCSHLAGQTRGSHTAVKANFAEDPARLQSVVALVSDVAADSTPVVAKTASKTAATSAKKPATKTTKKSTAKSPSKAAAKTAAKVTTSAAPKKTSKSSPSTTSKDSAQKSSGSRAVSSKAADKDPVEKVAAKKVSSTVATATSPAGEVGPGGRESGGAGSALTSVK
ncbi:MAG: hypothetical protein ACO1RT_20345 [Planctomycetaceae bacterium]